MSPQLSHFGVPATWVVANVALPNIAADLSVDDSAAVMIVTVDQLVLSMDLLPVVGLGDRVGHNRPVNRAIKPRYDGAR